MAMKSLKAISIIADEVTDVSNKEQLNLSLRWVSCDFEIHERPVELIHVPSTDANTIATMIQDCLVRFSLPITQCRGQAYDGAANMSGHVSGVAARLQKENHQQFLCIVWHTVTTCVSKI